ncbi:MAG: transcriptional regulator [Thaumarchaeota archaeon]|nr:MAG: transcriptional regulator [Nitrososphaerota archaeon]
MKASSRLEVIRNAHKKRKMDNHATFRMEDYLEAMYELIDHKGYATSVDLAECLNVSQPSVTKMMRRLDRTELIDYEKYRGIRLTEKGIKLAKSIHERHGIVSEFLKKIGVDENIANRDAEEIEHHIHPETLRKLQDLLEGKSAALHLTNQ